MFPKFRENVWHINPDQQAATLITSRATYEVPTRSALAFLKMRTYCTGRNSIDVIAERSGLSIGDVSALLHSLEPADIIYSDDVDDRISREHVRDVLMRAATIWSRELQMSYIGNEFVSGELPKIVLLGWLLEMYHYIKDFPMAIEHAAKRAEGALRDLLLRYADEETGHEEFVLQTLMNLGLTRDEVKSSIPLLSTRLVGLLMRELFELEPSSVLVVAAVIEAQDFNESQIAAFKNSINRHYGIDLHAFDPYFQHQQIDVGLGHAELLASHLDLIEVQDRRTLDQITNGIHDLKHSFDLQGVELKAYFTTLNGKYFPRQPVDFASI